MQEEIHVGRGDEGSKFHVLTILTIQFTLCLIFLRDWPIEDFFFEIRQIDKLQDGYNM